MVIKALGFSRSDAAFQRRQINSLVAELRQFRSKFTKFLLAVAIGLVVLIGAHQYLQGSVLQTAYLVAYYFGIVGTFLSCYGFLLNLRQRASELENKLKWIIFPNPPTRLDDDSFLVWSCSLMGKLSDYINRQSTQSWETIRVEFHRQVSLFIGFVLIAISFLIQLALQFF